LLEQPTNEAAALASVIAVKSPSVVFRMAIAFVP
jgi:hypothetical protein